jgi:hypothetical protein
VRWNEPICKGRLTMKKIKLTVPSRYTVVIDTQTAVKTLAATGRVDPVSLDVGVANRELDVARENGAQVVYAAAGVQNKLDEIIGTYFFGPIMGPNDRRDFFINQVLKSSDLTFAFRKRLACEIRISPRPHHRVRRLIQDHPDAIQPVLVFRLHEHGT